MKHKTIAIISHSPEIQAWIEKHGAMVDRHKQEVTDSWKVIHEIAKEKGFLPADAPYDDWCLEIDRDRDALLALHVDDHNKSCDENPFSSLLNTLLKK